MMDNKRLNFNDIPEKLKNVIRERFESDPHVRLERIKAQNLCNGGQYAEALYINKKMDELFCEVIMNYMQEAEKDVEQIDLSLSKLPPKDLC